MQKLLEKVSGNSYTYILIYSYFSWYKQEKKTKQKEEKNNKLNRVDSN